MPTFYAVSVALVIAFLLGAFCGWVLMGRWGRTLRLIRWDAAKQWSVSPQHLSAMMTAGSVTLRVGDRSLESLSLLSVSLAAAGNCNLHSVVAVITMNVGSEILGTRIVEGGESIAVATSNKDRGTCRVDIKLFRPRDTAVLEIAVKDYEDGSLRVEVADPGIDVKQRWRVGLHTPPELRSMSFGIPGARYDPAARAMITIAEELKSIRKLISR